ncbi:MAG: lytic transglycosylase domain-containing protein [Brevinema sp.]
MKILWYSSMLLFIPVFSFTNQELSVNLAETLVQEKIVGTSSSDMITNICLSNNIDISDTNEKSHSESTNTLSILSSSPDELSLPNDLLKGEYPLILKEFQDIVRLYNRLPSGQSKKVELLRALLARLQKISPKTDFLQSEKVFMEAAILYRLSVRGTAATKLKTLIKNSPYLVIRDKSARVFLSYSIVNGEIANIQQFYHDYNNYLSPELNAFLTILIKDPKQITPDEASFIFQNIVLSPLGSHSPTDTPIRILSTIKHQINLTELDTAINVLLHNKNDDLVLALIKVRLMLEEVSDDILFAWGRLLGKNEDELIKILRLTDSKRYQSHIAHFYKKSNATSRGRAYNVKLFRFRGEKKAPYHSALAEKAFQEYLKGDLEERYLSINSEYAFRNFLAFKQYDKIITYASMIQQKYPLPIPYVNFWQSYAMLELGQTNGVIELLGNVIADVPESYYGLLSKNLLTSLFKKVSFSKNNYFQMMKSKSTNGYMDLLRYAHVMYYLGSRSERGQAEKIYMNLGIIKNTSRTKISNEKRSLFTAYLDLGFQKDALSLSYSEGVLNPYIRDVLLGEYFLSQNKIKEYKNIIAQRSDFIHNTFSFMMPKESLKMYYPLLYRDSILSLKKKTNRPMDMYLLYSVIRAESFYKIKARSRVGARGLMQIMPRTGEYLAKKYLEPGASFSLSNLYEPDLNIYFGSMYLYDNIDRMGVIPALAAYNSGPTFVNRLIKQYKPNSDLELLEIHPKRETRNYVRKIMEFYYRYKTIYEGQEIQIFNLLS